MKKILTILTITLTSTSIGFCQFGGLLGGGKKSSGTDKDAFIQQGKKFKLSENKDMIVDVSKPAMIMLMGTFARKLTRKKLKKDKRKTNTRISKRQKPKRQKPKKRP